MTKLSNPCAVCLGVGSIDLCEGLQESVLIPCRSCAKNKPVNSKLSDEWQTVKGFPDYRINSLGNIMSVKYGREYILKLSVTKIGYLQVTLDSYNKKYVHHLMAIQYFNHIPSKQLQVNHKDGDKTNNRLENLEIVTPKQNTNHAITIGIHKNQKGENNYSSKLTDAQAREIKYLLYWKKSIKDIALKYGVSTTTIYLILEGKTWKHV